MAPGPHGRTFSKGRLLRLSGGFLVAVAGALLLRGVGTPALAALPPAGDDVPACLECHEEEQGDFAKGSHALLARAGKTDAAGTCALCHGPADPRHAESGGAEGVTAFSKMDPDAMAAACARCHTHHPEHVRDWKSSEYRQAGLDCAECHSIHEESQNVIHLEPADAARGVLGTAACRVCHPAAVEAAPASIHAKVVAEPALDSCEMCHLGGARHLEAIRAPKAMEGAGFATGDACLLCHAQMPERHGKNLLPSVLKSLPSPLTAATCTTCHDPHLPMARTVSGRGLAGGAGQDDLREAGAVPAGAASCAKCHADKTTGLPSTLHGRSLRDLGDRTCEACHGPASLHVETGGNRRAITAASPTEPLAQALYCLRCHEKTAPDHARNFAASPYAGQGRTCASCHSVHAPLPELPAGGFRTMAESLAGSAPVGSAACAKCHEEPHPGIERSRHGPLFATKAGREKAAGCEGCHGNGGAHAASSGRPGFILNPAKMEGKAKADLCLSCHEDTTSPGAWGRHPHGSSEVSCLSCHDPFGPPGTPAKAKQPELCASCHPMEVAQFRLPNRHPVPEGAMGCSDCHDLHRPAPAARAAARWKDTCAECHRAEATPRLHPHEADRTEGCIACHEPHGTTSPRMLRFSRVVDLCLSCHIPPTSHDLAPGGAFASCLACHTEVHGSDASAQFLR